MTRPRPGKLRKVSVIVPCRYSLATARMPKIRANTAARPTCAIARLWTAGSCRFAPERTRPVTPATTITGPAAKHSGERGDAGGVGAVGGLGGEETRRVAEEGRGRAGALAHAE